MAPAELIGLQVPPRMRRYADRARGVWLERQHQVHAFRSTKWYDLLAAAPLIGFYGYAGYQQFETVWADAALTKVFLQTDFRALPPVVLARCAANLATFLFIAVVAALLAARRTPIARSKGLYPRGIAIVGTFLGLAIVELPPQELPVSLYMLSLVLVAGGTGLALVGVLTLGRSMSIMPEARALVTSGPYARIRHPIYAGELVALSGITLQYLSPAAIAVLMSVAVLQLSRLNTEERVLAETFPHYRDYAQRTARLVPAIY